MTDSRDPLYVRFLRAQGGNSRLLNVRDEITREFDRKLEYQKDNLEERLDFKLSLIEDMLIEAKIRLSRVERKLGI